MFIGRAEHLLAEETHSESLRSDYPRDLIKQKDVSCVSMSPVKSPCTTPSLLGSLVASTNLNQAAFPSRCHVPSNCLLQPLLKSYRWSPAQMFTNFVEVDGVPAIVPRTIGDKVDQ